MAKIEYEKNIDNFDIRNFFKRWQFFYFFIANVFGPMMFCGLSAVAFLKRYPSEGKVLNLGSGPRILSKGVVNVDFYPYTGVEIVADINSVPLPDASVARIISDNVLEHTSLPSKAVLEMRRLLCKDGLAYISTPFLYPFHTSPSDYQRWTDEGLRELFKDFEMVEIGVRAGPFSALTVYLNHLFSIIFSFGSHKIASILLNLIMFVTFPIKFLDLVFNHCPRSVEIAAVLYCVVRKK
ncbi:methyltransferase domain-containing protein [Candidatus Kaiserbacteria bacterium]|nr:MAG: methyltransferase domain-containing protein [Candidatus Kaiserbacteria bacterium]